MKINTHYSELQDSYLFSSINHKVAAYRETHPEAEIISLGIGDVTRPLCPAVIEAMNDAVTEMGEEATFHGYGPEQGYSFLRTALKQYYAGFGVDLQENEIFVSDGAKSDLGNILDLFDEDNIVLVPNPVYPAYVDTNVMAGRRIVYMNATEENGFLPMPEESVAADLIYLCSPNNPTGAVYTTDQLQRWVNYANARGALILFDAAYESFVSDAALPHSIFETEGARTCAIEFCSLSKTAGFTGTRCGYTVVPTDLIRGGQMLNKLWLRRQTTKFNGVSYIVQRGAAAVFTNEGQRQVHANVDYYRENARLIGQALRDMNIWYTGGENSPYLWMKCPQGMSSWKFFEYLLDHAHLVGTPGVGFGENGEGFFRLSAFGSREKTHLAVTRLSALELYG